MLISTCVIIMVLQQYLFSPKSSKILSGSSPFFTRCINSSYLSAIKLPHVKQRIGISITFYLGEKNCFIFRNFGNFKIK